MCVCMSVTSALDTIDVILKKLGPVLDNYESQLLHIVTCMAGHTSALLELRAQVAPRAVNTLKVLRTMAQTRMIEVVVAAIPETSPRLILSLYKMYKTCF